MNKKIKFLVADHPWGGKLNPCFKRILDSQIQSNPCVNYVSSKPHLWQFSKSDHKIAKHPTHYLTINKGLFSTSQPPANIDHNKTQLAKNNYNDLQKLTQEQLENFMEFFSLKNQNYLVKNVKYLRQTKKLIQFYEQTTETLSDDPIGLVNMQISLLKAYHSRRYQFLTEQKHKQTQKFDIGSQILSMNQHILNSTSAIMSTLHYIVSSEEFNKQYLANKNQAEYPFVGRLIRVLVDVMQNQSLPQSELYRKLVLNIVELLDLYMNTFVHLIVNPLEHMYFNQALDTLIELKVNYPNGEINSLIIHKYTKPKTSTGDSQQITYINPILYHKSFALPQSKYSLSLKPQFNYEYSEINEAYFSFFKTLLSNGVIASQVKPFVQYTVIKTIDSHLDNGSQFTGKRDELMQGLAVYVQCMRTLDGQAVWKIQPQSDNVDQFISLMARLGFLIKQIEIFMIEVSSFTQLTKSSSQLKLLAMTTKENLLYLLFFSFRMLTNLKSSTFIQELPSDQAEVLCSFGEQVVQQVFGQQKAKGLGEFVFGDFDSPKLQCIQLQLYFQMLRVDLQDKKGNYAYKKCRQKVIEKMIENLSARRFEVYPYVYLTWFYDRSLDIMITLQSQYSNSGQNPRLDFIRIKEQLLFSTIQSIVSNPINKLSYTNNIHSLYSMAKNLLSINPSDQQQTGRQHQILGKLSSYLNSHTKQQLLTQTQEDLCELFEHLLPAKGLFAGFLSHVTQVSFGEFQWESFNKLYFYSVLYLRQSDQREISESQKMNMEYVRRYILNEYNAMGVSRREIPTHSYFYKILQIETPASFYKNYFEHYGQRH